jgi:sarcosine oxidase
MDRLPGHERVHVVSACSGHGFKFASVVGEIVADLVTDGSSKFDLSLFSIRRFERHTA